MNVFWSTRRELGCWHALCLREDKKVIDVEVLIKSFQVIGLHEDLYKLHVQSLYKVFLFLSGNILQFWLLG